MVLVTADVSDFFVQSRLASCVAYSKACFTVCLFVFLGVCEFEFVCVSLNEYVQSAEVDVHFFGLSKALQQVSVDEYLLLNCLFSLRLTVIGSY